MKITIITDGEDKELELVLTDEELNNDNFVDLVIDNATAQVPIEELYSAVKAFYEMHCRRLEQDARSL